MTLIKEKAGVISNGPCWCLWHNGYLYTHDTLIGVLWLAFREWNHDRHLIG